jgi:(1->4)-alpha-D-glucan 1-alpha-D-glucosylmutase
MTPMAHRPESTYRLQISPSFTLDDAADVTDYLRDLGVSWVYLSPLLAATSGSAHGYDVVDPSRIDDSRGGPEGFERFVARARDAGLGVLVDIVPNHVGVGTPRENPWWWDVLRLGRVSPHAVAFDIDWEHGGGRVRLPILGADLDTLIAAGDIAIDPEPAADAPDGTLVYFEHVLPLAPGSGRRGDDVRAVLDAQHYELRFWRDQSSELNYRRFFGVSELAGVRVEVPEVFAASHREILRWVHEGLADGLRVDHPDGLTDPGAYLDRLADATGGAYTLVEKILEPGEELPSWWRVDGTTGYDALAEIDRLLTDPEGERVLDQIDGALRAETGVSEAPAWNDLSHSTKRMIADEVLQSEVRRLVRNLPSAVPGADEALAEILASFPVYRSYLPAGREHLDAAVDDAARRRPDLAEAIHALAPVLSDPRLEVARRFEQTSGPVMAKGVEDTAFYRFTRLSSLTEVGADPSIFSLTPHEFHAAQQKRLAAWPHSMTTLSTHDTKRSEDVRARLAVLAELPDRWADVLGRLRGIATTGHGPLDSLLWQAAVGAWPISAERLEAYAVKAARESGESTTWWSPDAGFEAGLAALARAAHGEARDILTGFVTEISPPGWSNSLSAKLLQLTAPGVPDVYQGSELWDLSLVDPDNRREVDFDARRQMLGRLDADAARGVLPGLDSSGAAKLLVTSRALRLRRGHPERFERYRPIPAEGEASAHLVAVDRGGIVAVATRLPVGLARRGGWGDTALPLSDTPVTDALTGRRFEGGRIRVGELLDRLPVALLVEEP